MSEELPSYGITLSNAAVSTKLITIKDSNKPWLTVGMDGNVQLFDEAECRRQAAAGEQYARAFLALLLHERERCAKICEDLNAFDEDDPGGSAAAAIRAQGGIHD